METLKAIYEKHKTIVHVVAGLVVAVIAWRKFK